MVLTDFPKTGRRPTWINQNEHQERESATIDDDVLQGSIRALASRGLVLIVGLSIGCMAAPPAFAQISLGQAGDYSLFQASVGSSPNIMSISGSTISNDVGMGANAVYALSSTTITGGLYEDSNTFGSTSNLTTGAGIFSPVNLSQAASDAGSAAAAAAGSTPSATYGNIGSMSFTGNAAQNTFNLSSLNLNGGQITISGSGLFVFNITGTIGGTGSNSSDAMFLSNAVVQASSGVTGIIFNIENGGNVSIGGNTGSQVVGTILDMSHGSVSLSNTNLEGSLITNGNIAIANSYIVAPEMPTIVMAGFAGLILVARGGLKCLRGRRRTLRIVTPPQP